MTECAEIAAGMTDGYRAWLSNTSRSMNMDTARNYVRMQMSEDERHQIIDNVAYDLISFLTPPMPKRQPYPDQGSW